MKKLILSLSFCFALSVALAQPTLTSTKMLAFGQTMKFKYVTNINVIDTTIQGANKTWNFSSLINTTDSGYEVTISNPASTPYGSDFATANYAYTEIQYPDTAYAYFDLSTANMQRVGSWSQGTITTYTDPQIEYIFPLTLGASNNDTWANTSSTYGGTYDINCIGYGTLILPTGTYTNALMVRVWVSETGLYTFPVYFWYSSDNGAILCEYIVGDGFFYSPEAEYLQSLSAVGINEVSMISNVRFNNPVADNLNLSFTCKKPSMLEYNLMNTLGETVLTRNYAAGAQQTEHVEMNFSGLAPGLYFLSIKSNQPGEEVRIIKVMKM